MEMAFAELLLLSLILFGAGTICESLDFSVDFTCGIDDGVGSNDDDRQSCQILIGKNFSLNILQTAPGSKAVTYGFEYSIAGETLQEPVKDGRLMFAMISSLTLTGNASRTIFVDTKTGDDRAGELRIAITYNGSYTKVVDVTITRSNWLRDLGTVIGWIYFLAWSVSFYPQCWINFRRKSVIGLNFDFISLNLTGFTCYAIYNLSLFYNAAVRQLFSQEHPLGVIQVDPNDVFFALHAITLTLITIVQCSIYERGQQTVSRFCRVLLLAMILFALICLVLAAVNVIHWLRFVEYLSYIKLLITLIKYIPQAYMNYRRKSTDGWSIGNILLDFTGGSLSILQMFLKSYNYDDWRSIFGNVTKFGIGLFSILFDVLFILQHYVFYRDSEPTKKENPAAEDSKHTPEESKV